MRRLLLLLALAPLSTPAAETLKLNEKEYLEMPGLNVMLAHDYYPEGHQGGVGIIQNGVRVATNGDLRLDRTPGQWQPTPTVGKREINRATGEISIRMSYPDDTKNRKGFNPIDYPDLNFSYTLRVVPEGSAFRIIVDLDTPIPDAFIGKVGFNLELFPGSLFGKTWSLGDTSGIFPRQANGPGRMTPNGEYEIAALGKGKRLTVAPESDRQRMTISSADNCDLELIDGRGQHTNGWFVVRSLVTKGATKQAVNWLIEPNALPGFVADPVVQISQVGYHSKQTKTAVIEIDPRDQRPGTVVVSRIREQGGLEDVLKPEPKAWGAFLRSNYLRVDFTSITKPGMYVVRYGTFQSEPFRIADDVYQRHVWQPTLEYFLPIQMCHMRISDRYQIWHGACHLDDALMAPVNFNLFDGYSQGPSTLSAFKPGDHVPGIDVGGWHDAGDYDLRIESQAETVYGMALAREAFGIDFDDTTIDQANHNVEMHRPDGKPDILQQVEHGVLSIVGGYKSLGRLYRGIQEVSMRQYVNLGDPSTVTDNRVFNHATAGVNPPAIGLPGSPDDRLVFTEEEPRHELEAAAALAAAGRVLKGFNDPLAADCRRIAIELWDRTKENQTGFRVPLAVELLISTGDARYADFLKANTETISKGFRFVGWSVGRSIPLVNDAAYTASVTAAAKVYQAEVESLATKTPYGVPYKPDIWGDGWDIQRFGMSQYFLHKAFPEIVSTEYLLASLNFILGCHPGQNTASFVTGVGSHTVTTAYGINRADWSYLPGGIISGTAIIRPDFPELLVWPFLWQQTEYCLGGSTSDYFFLVLGAEQVLQSK